MRGYGKHILYNTEKTFLSKLKLTLHIVRPLQPDLISDLIISLIIQLSAAIKDD